jgi:ElaB/YqjD/DUF883 family membrane-anchored ribosome-binding protein
MADPNDRFTWDEDDTYWRTNFRNRPYASPGRDYDFYRPGYRYGNEAAHRYQNRKWDEVESNLSRDWNSYAHRGESTWDQIKGAVRDAWDRVETVASTIEERAESIPGGQKVKEVAQAAADRLSTTADYMRSHDARRMISDVETVVRNNPGPALVIAAVLGFMLGRTVVRN